MQTWKSIQWCQPSCLPLDCMWAPNHLQGFNFHYYSNQEGLLQTKLWKMQLQARVWWPRRLTFQSRQQTSHLLWFSVFIPPLNGWRQKSTNSIPEGMWAKSHCAKSHTTDWHQKASSGMECIWMSPGYQPTPAMPMSTVWSVTSYCHLWWHNDRL